MSNGGPAFPTLTFELDGQGNYVYCQENGISKLDYFAAEAMKAHLSHWGRQDGMESVVFDIAESMLAESDKRNEARETKDGT